MDWGGEWRLPPHEELTRTVWKGAVGGLAARLHQVAAAVWPIPCFCLQLLAASQLLALFFFFPGLHALCLLTLRLPYGDTCGKLAGPTSLCW